MVRTIISIEEDDWAWLDHRAAEEKVSRAELIRKAVRLYRQAAETQARSFHRLLEDTAGMWKGEDGLSYQLRLRDEWVDQADRISGIRPPLQPGNNPTSAGRPRCLPATSENTARKSVVTGRSRPL